MSTIKIEYTVNDDYVETNIKNIKTVIQELKELNVQDVRYTIYHSGGSFTHIAESTNGEPGDTIGKLAAFTTFREMMKDHLVAPPKQTAIELVDRSH